MVTQHQKIVSNLSTDCVIFGFNDQQLKILLIQLDVDPGKGEWALPGSNILEEENLDDAANRVLKELTGLEDVYMEQVHAFGDVERFPLFRVITVAYYALIKPEKYKLRPGDKTRDAKWFSIDDLPDLPFDHDRIIKYSLKQLKTKIRTKPIGFELLPKKFTLTQLQSLYEAIYGIEMDKRNFRRKILNLDMLVKLDEMQKNVAHRAPWLYRFDKKKYNKLKEKGFNFEI